MCVSEIKVILDSKVTSMSPGSIEVHSDLRVRGDLLFGETTSSVSFKQDGYISFGTGSGDETYGLRDVTGKIQFKNKKR